MARRNRTRELEISKHGQTREGERKQTDEMQNRETKRRNRELERRIEKGRKYKRQKDRNTNREILEYV